MSLAPLKDSSSPKNNPKRRGNADDVVVRKKTEEMFSLLDKKLHQATAIKQKHKLASMRNLEQKQAQQAQAGSPRELSSPRSGHARGVPSYGISVLDNVTTAEQDKISQRLKKFNSKEGLIGQLES